MNGLALCTGGGGLEAALHIVSSRYRTICAVERQAYAAAAFVEWMEKTKMGACPVWDDVTTFDPGPWCGLVDIITAGYPCQPFSYAGKGLGENDPRHLWPFIYRHICALMPPLVFCENVAAHLTRGFDTVKGNLERIGYTVAAGIFSAAEVGAPHLRERLFILGQLADRNSAWKPQPQGHFPEGRGWPGNSGINLANASGGTVQTGTEQPGRNTGADTHWGITRPDVADNQSLGRPQGWPEPAREQGRPCPTGNGSGMGDSNRIHCDRRSDIEGRAQERGTASCRASHVGHADNNAERAGLCPECSKGFRGGRHCDAGCHMGNADRTGLQVRPGNARATDDTFTGWPWPAGRGADQHGWEKPRLIKSGMGGTAYGVGARSEQLLVLGNGVVPVAGALAFVALWKELNGNG